jgi:hypothetical protein
MGEQNRGLANQIFFADICNQFDYKSNQLQIKYGQSGPFEEAASV